MAPLRFEAVVQVEGASATYVEVPLDVPALFGRVRAPVRGTLAGAAFRTTVMRYGDRYFIPVNRALREAARVQAGETVVVELEADDAPRRVTPPPELGALLAADAAARAGWERLSFTARREHAEAIESARRPETRRRRLERTLAALRVQR